MAQTTDRPATEKQLAYLKSLVAERDLTMEWDGVADSPSARSTSARVARETALAIHADKGFLPESAFKLVLDYLKAAPRKASAQAEPGYYVTADGTAVKVQMNKAGTNSYALVWGGSSWDYAPGIARQMVGMAPMTGEEAARLGLASGKCIVCVRTLGGKSLTAKVAALIGYGETFPKGAVNQRAVLAANSCEDEPVVEHLSLDEIQHRNASRFD
jgi:hypothetical protein